MRNKITVVIVTYKTNRNILVKCIASIDKKIRIIIVENSRKFEDKKYLIKKFKNLKIFCSGSNMGYGRGNNYGLKKVKTKYALILSPDAYCSKNFFKNLNKNLKNVKDFYLMGCADSKSKKIYTAGYFDKYKNKNFEKRLNSKKINLLTKVDWIRGFSIIINLKKFSNLNIFDKNYFLFMEEIDLCKFIKEKSGNIYLAKNLKVDHLGFKGSIGACNSNISSAENLRNWHYMWSSFYFYKKNYSYFFSIKKMFGKFLRSFFKFIFKKKERDKYLYRFLGILSSMIGLPSYFRDNKFY